MTNATEDYNTFVRANLPSGMTYSNFRYWVRGKPFVSYKQAKWYLDYTTKMIYLNPPLNFDFTTGTMPAGVTFTRAGSATYFDAAGVLRTAAADQPRFDHDPVTKAPKGLLIEGSRTNLLLQSNDFTHTTWSKINSTATSVPATFPAASVALLVENTATDFHYTSQYLETTIPSTVYTFSVYAKAAGRTRLRYQTDGTSGSGRIDFDLATGTTLNVFGNVAPVSFTPVGDGWFYCSANITTNTTGGSLGAKLLLSIGGPLNYAGDGTSGVLLANAQVEVGAFPSSYIPTTTSAATRAADTAVMTGTNFSRWFNPVEGTIAVDFSTFNTGINPGGGNSFDCVFDIDSAASINSDYNLFLSVAYPGYRGHVNVAGANQAIFNSTLPLGTGALTKYAVAYKANDFAASYNGGAALVDAAGTLPPAPDRIAIGSTNGGAGNPLFGHIRSIRYWPRRLSNARLQELTA